MEYENLKSELKAWNAPSGFLQTEEDTLDFYRVTYNGKVQKKELETYLTSLQDWEKYAYEHKKLFEMTYFLSNNQPYAGLLLNDGNAIVEFIDEHNRIYMRYTFSGRYKTGSLFLDSLRYFIYADDNFYSTSKSKDVVRYQFTPEGKLTVTKHLANGDGTDTKTVDEAAHPINVSGNWEPYPELGKYEGLVKLKRWGEGDLLKGIMQ